MTNKKYFFYIVLTIPCDMIKKFILKTFIVRKIHYERKLALFLKKSDKATAEDFTDRVVRFLHLMYMV